MRSARTVALAALLAASACVEREDPYAPGWSFGDDADHDGFVSADDCNDRDARVAFLVNAYRDADGDGVGGEPVQVCAGQGYLPPGFASQGGDCDDQRAEVHASLPLYFDADGDGIGAGAPEVWCIGYDLPERWSVAGDDCMPGDATAWRLLPYAARDADGDGYFVAKVAEVSEVCSGAGLPPGYISAPSWTLDCDDSDPARYRVVGPAYADADGDGLGAGPALEVCTGEVLPPGYARTADDCAPADPAAWQPLTYLYVDADRDGTTVPAYGQLCTGAQLPAGYLTVASGDDCDDADAARAGWRSLLPDPDGDGHGSGASERVCTGAVLPAGWAAQGEDCAPADATRWRAFAYTARDADGDARTVAESGTLCLDDGPPPAGYRTAASGDDCDDGDPAVWARVSGYVDSDGDGVGLAPPVTSCTAGALPAGQVAAAGDCAPDDASRWRVLSYGFADRDGDGATVVEAGQVCTGAALPEPYRTVKAGNDCDDGTIELFRWVVLYPDHDGDGIGAPPRQIPCLGAALPAGFSLEGWDEDDGDPGVLLATPSP